MFHLIKCILFNCIFLFRVILNSDKKEVTECPGPKKWVLSISVKEGMRLFGKITFGCLKVVRVFFSDSHLRSHIDLVPVVFGWAQR